MKVRLSMRSKVTSLKLFDSYNTPPGMLWSLHRRPSVDRSFGDGDSADAHLLHLTQCHIGHMSPDGVQVGEATENNTHLTSYDA